MTRFRTFVLFLASALLSPHLLLADTLYHAAGDPPRGIDMYDPLSGTYLGSFGRDELSNPWGVNFAPDGSLYVGDWGRNVIEQYDPATGERLRMVATAQRPLALLVRDNGHLLVCQELEDNIAEYDAQGTLLRTFGVCGADLEIGPDGLLYVARNQNLWEPARNVYAYSLDTGDLVKSLPIPDFLRLSYFPVGLAFNPQGDLLVSEFHFGKILTFDIETDQYTGLFADLDMDTICDIDFGPDGNLYAAHTGGDRFLILDGQSGELLREIQGVNEPRQLTFGHAAVPAPSSFVCLLGLLASAASIGWWRKHRQ